MKLSFTKEEHEEFIKNHFQIKTAHVIDEENEMYYILPVKEDYTKHDRVIAKTQAEKFGFVFGDGLMVLDYKPIKPTCANYERDNTEISIIKDEHGQNPSLLSEMEQNVADYIAKKDWKDEYMEHQIEQFILQKEKSKINTAKPIVFNGSYFPCSDPIVESVRKKLLDRSNVGIKKYGEQLGNFSKYNFIFEMQNEALDFANYCEVELQKEETINQLVAKYPNNMELGSEIRKIYGK
jgi:hypothetical protein